MNEKNNAGTGKLEAAPDVARSAGSRFFEPFGQVADAATGDVLFVADSIRAAQAAAREMWQLTKQQFQIWPFTNSANVWNREA